MTRSGDDSAAYKASTITDAMTVATTRSMADGVAGATLYYVFVCYLRVRFLYSIPVPGI